jgi:hypothetical protein
MRVLVNDFEYDFGNECLGGNTKVETSPNMPTFNSVSSPMDLGNWFRMSYRMLNGNDFSTTIEYGKYTLLCTISTCSSVLLRGTSTDGSRFGQTEKQNIVFDLV